MFHENCFNPKSSSSGPCSTVWAASLLAHLRYPCGDCKRSRPLCEITSGRMFNGINQEDAYCGVWSTALDPLP